MENNTTAKKQLPAFVILGIIALVAALVLALTNVVTRGPIAEHEMAALKDAFAAVMPAEEYEQIEVPAEYDVRSLYAAKSGGEIIGYCVTAAGKGYSADVAVTLGVGLDGVVTGASVGDPSFAESPGYGMRAKEPAFQEQFAGLDAVNGGAFQALSGATVTSTAVLNAVNQALACVDKVALNKEPAAEPLVVFGAPPEKAEVELVGEILEGSAWGFKSDVVVKITLDESGAVSGMDIDSSGETEGYGQRLMTEPFAEQFIGQTGPFAIDENINVLSGATVTSRAVVEAVNAAMAEPTSADVAEQPVTLLVSGDKADVGVRADGAAVIAPADGYTGELNIALSVKNGQVTGGEFVRPVEDAAAASGELTASKRGYASNVTVTVTLNEDKTIATLAVDASKETEYLGQEAGNEEFTSQFIGKAAPFTLGEGIDAVAGATITSQTVVDLLNGLLVTDAGEEASDELTASKRGYASNVTVTVTLNADKTIATLAVDASKETEYLGQEAGNEEFTSQFIGEAAPFTLGEGIDAVAGATITSQTVVDLLNGLLVTDAAEEASDELTASKRGYASNVTVTVTLNEDKTIATLAVDASKETEYLGQEAGNEEFTSQFIGKAAPFTLGEGIDAVAGATITSQTVVDLLNGLLVTDAAEEASDELTASKRGYASNVTVTVTLNEDKTIATLTVDASKETEYLGQEAGNEEFTSQFIGKAAPFTLGEGIDAVAGATITSQTVVDLLNGLLAADEAEEASDELTASKRGYASNVTVTVTLNADKTIATLTVDASKETEYLGQEAGNEEFTSQFIGKAAPFTLGEGIDAVAGATITSQTVVDLLNGLLGE